MKIILKQFMVYSLIKIIIVHVKMDIILKITQRLHFLFTQYDKYIQVPGVLSV